MPTRDQQPETSPEPSISPPTEPDEPSQEAEQPPADVSPQLDEVPPPLTSRPRRAAASEAQARIFALTLDENESFS